MKRLRSNRRGSLIESGVQLTGDESLDHLNGTVRLGTRGHNPAVLSAWVDLVVNLAARRPVRPDEMLLHCW